MKIVRLGKHGVVDLEALTVTVFGRKAKLRPIPGVPPEYLEPFVGVEEPKAWVRIEGKTVVVKVKDTFFAGEIE
mgnify:CR=1 FL=1